MGIGAVFGALNTMYSAVAARTREIATLRALGFGSGPWCCPCCWNPWWWRWPAAASAARWRTWFRRIPRGYDELAELQPVAFAFAVTPGLLLKGVLYAVAIGLVAVVSCHSAPPACPSSPPSGRCETEDPGCVMREP